MILVIEMDVLEQIRALLLAKPGAEETYPFDPVTLVVKVGGKMFALLSLTDQPVQLSLKCEPTRGEGLRDVHPAIRPGYHLNKRHWITLTLDGTLPPALVQQLIDDSYRLVMAGLPRAERERLGG
jgi:predicted DNA-binding protein (MmcQ/YjbR family)